VIILRPESKKLLDIVKGLVDMYVKYKIMDVNVLCEKCHLIACDKLEY
jgi:hypothetical protein